MDFPYGRGYTICMDVPFPTGISTTLENPQISVYGLSSQAEISKGRIFQHMEYPYNEQTRWIDHAHSDV